MDCFSPSDKLFMHQALSEGRRALPACLPNPPVGCVLVRNGQIIARGFTQAPGQHHAEAMAMAQLDGDADDVTAYVTLEPCSFHGRTPSCATALVKRGIQRVCVAMLDPDPRNAGPVSHCSRPRASRCWWACCKPRPLGTSVATSSIRLALNR